MIVKLAKHAQIYHDEMMAMSCDWAKKYSLNPFPFLLMVSKTSIPKFILGEAYETLTKCEHILRIEDLPQDEKDSLWKECKETGGKDKEEMITLCKILHVLKNLI